MPKEEVPLPPAFKAIAAEIESTKAETTGDSGEEEEFDVEEVFDWETAMKEELESNGE